MVSLLRKFYIGNPGDGGASTPVSPTPTKTPIPSRTPSVSKTPSVTPTISVSTTPSVSITATPSVTPSISLTPTPSRSLGTSPSSTPSVTQTPSPSISVSVTPTVTPTISKSPTATISVTPTVTKTPTATISVTPSITITPSITHSPTPSVTPSPSADCSQLNIFAQMQQAALQFMKTDVAYYKHNLHQTKRNIYGESLEKWYFQPFLVKTTIERNDDVIINEMFGPDVTKSAKLTIPKVAWEQGNAGLIEGKNMLPEIGDIIYDRSTERYYEVNNIVSNYTPINANIGVGQSNCPQAELVTYNIQCHQTRVSKLNLLPYKLL